MKTIYVISGGTLVHVTPHFALCAPAYGQVGVDLTDAFYDALAHEGEGRQVVPIFTKMARASWMTLRERFHPDVWNRLAELSDVTLMHAGVADVETNADLETLVDYLVTLPDTRGIVLATATCDWQPTYLAQEGAHTEKFGKKVPRLKSRRADGGPSTVTLMLAPTDKILPRIRKTRKDIFVAGFKTTTGEAEQDQYVAGLNLLKSSGINLVLANDLTTRTNMVITPEESRYHVTTNRIGALQGLVSMFLNRSNLRFTRSTVVGTEADLVPWTDPRIPSNLRTVVDYCVAHGAYKPFRGSTAGHFAVKVGEGEFLTSLRKRNYNTDLHRLGLVRVTTEGEDSVVAHGARPSVGGQSQRSVFRDHPETDCIVHFHCPLKTDAPDVVSVRPQRDLECGSHECGENTASGLKAHGNIKAVMLDNHGPNIVFSKDADPDEVIRFIDRNFDLGDKTGGLLV